MTLFECVRGASGDTFSKTENICKTRDAIASNLGCFKKFSSKLCK